VVTEPHVLNTHDMAPSLYDPYCESVEDRRNQVEGFRRRETVVNNCRVAEVTSITDVMNGDSFKPTVCQRRGFGDILSVEVRMTVSGAATYIARLSLFNHYDALVEGKHDDLLYTNAQHNHGCLGSLIIKDLSGRYANHL